jgi:hypothetical protein
MRGLTSGCGDKDEDLILVRSEVGFGALSAIPVGFVANNTPNIRKIVKSG